jgi:pimeloyl-ACP methyl ester carboxylesterase
VRRAGPSGFDPLPALRALRIPIYWAYGGLDRNQPTGLDVHVLQQLRAETGADYAWRVFPNGDHGLFEVQTGLLSERRTSRGLSPDFVPSVDAWLRARGLAT